MEQVAIPPYPTCCFRTVRGRKGQKPGRICGRRAQHTYGVERKFYCWPHYKQLVAREAKQKANATILPPFTEATSTTPLVAAAAAAPPSNAIVVKNEPSPMTIEAEEQVIELPLTEEPPRKKARTETPEEEEKEKGKEKAQGDEEATQEYDWVEEVLKDQMWDTYADMFQESFMEKIMGL